MLKRKSLIEIEKERTATNERLDILGNFSFLQILPANVC